MFQSAQRFSALSQPSLAMELFMRLWWFVFATSSAGEFAPMVVGEKSP
jgi:hypothetical protein